MNEPRIFKNAFKQGWSDFDAKWKSTLHFETNED